VVVARLLNAVVRRSILALILTVSQCALVSAAPQEPTAFVEPVAAGVTDLKFGEMFKLPVGSRGLEPSEKLLHLDGRRVHIVGYMVNQEAMRSFILAPLPLALGDEDESFADDLPPAVVFVHRAAQGDLQHIPGLVAITGILSVGCYTEADGRVSMVRLTLYPNTSQETVRHVPK